MSLKNISETITRKRIKSSDDVENRYINKVATSATIVRNPLKDLSRNVQIENNKNKTLKISSSFKKEEKTKRRLVRSISISGTEKKQLKNIVSNHITERQTNQDQSEVFVPGEEHFINFVSTGSQTKLKKNISNTEKIAIIPSRKVALITRLSQKRSRKNNVPDLYTDLLYHEEYGLDSFSYLLSQERKYVFRFSYLRKYVHESYRYAVVNWLVYVQQVLKISERSFFATIRMFDQIVIDLCVEPSMYIIAAVTCLWLAHKFFDSFYLGASKLCALCGQKFSKVELTTMEKKILTTLKWNINYSEPESFLFYYLNNFNMDNNSIIRNSAMFLLELTALLLDFSATAPSVLAAGALYLTLEKLNCNYDAFLEFVREHLLKLNLFKMFVERIRRLINEILKCESVRRDVVAKYSTEEKSNVSKYFCS